MAALVLVEALAIALLGLLVVGLLRSHAEILRELHRLGADLEDAGHPPRGNGSRASVSLGPPRQRVRGGVVAADLAGTTPTQESVQLGLAGARHDTLLAFLSSGCNTCSGLWRSLKGASSIALPDNTRLVVVTKGPAEESLSRIRELAPAEVPVVMSTEAWKDYAVPVTPYFVYVDGPTGQVVGQGSGSSWTQVISLLHQAAEDERASRADTPGTRASTEREPDVDHKLLAAGIRPGDPSLYAPPPDRA